MGWQLYAITGSALDLGLVGLVQFLPMILLTLVVGRFADRYDRRTIVSCCLALESGAATLLALGSAGGWLGRESIASIATISVGGTRTRPSVTSTRSGQALPRATMNAALSARTCRTGFAMANAQRTERSAHERSSARPPASTCPQ